MSRDIGDSCDRRSPGTPATARGLVAFQLDPDALYIRDGCGVDGHSTEIPQRSGT